MTKNIMFYHMMRCPEALADIRKAIKPTHWSANGPRAAISIAPVRAMRAILLSAAMMMIQTIPNGIHEETSMLIIV